MSLDLPPTTEAAPWLRVVAGNPDPDELAALVSVLVSTRGGHPEPNQATSFWAAGARKVRGPVLTGIGGWRASALPR